MRIAFALPGLHRIDRGAEVSFLSIADQLARRGHEVTLFGSGQPRPDTAYRFRHVGALPREKFERWPHGPMFRDETAYEELSFAAGLMFKLKPSDYDIVGGCSYPFVNWVLRRPVFGRHKPEYVYITQNGDHPAQTRNREYRFFGCDGIVCINPDFHERNKMLWNSVLIPNGVNTGKFKSARSDRAQFGLPADKKIVLMVSALIASKRVDHAIEAVSKLADVWLVVAGNGPEKESVLRLAENKLPGRFINMSLKADQMPALYHSADAFLHMSKAEAFGNVFIEALACGLPVVAHDIPRHRWVVGDTGFFVNTDRSENTAQAVQQALGAAVTDRENRIQSIEKYDWALVADQYERFFQSMLGQRAT